MVMNKPKRIVVEMIFLMLVLVGCGKSSNDNGPSKKVLKSIVPTDILFYQLDGYSYASEIIDLEVEKGIETEIGYDAYCKITLEDGNMCRVKYYIFHCAKIKTLPWELAYYEEYADEEILYIKKGPELNVVKEAEGLGEINEINDVSTYKDNSFTYESNLNHDYIFYSCEGTISISGYLTLINADISEYGWVINANTDNMTYDMSYLEGVWIASESYDYLCDSTIDICEINPDTQEVKWMINMYDEDLFEEGTSSYSFTGDLLSFSFEVQRKNGKQPYLFTVSFYTSEKYEANSDWKCVTVEEFDQWSGTYWTNKYSSFEKW